MDEVPIVDPTAIWRAGVIGVLACTVLLVFLRISGKRTLSRMNAFDLVTVAPGSTLSSRWRCAPKHCWPS